VLIPRMLTCFRVRPSSLEKITVCQEPQHDTNRAYKPNNTPENAPVIILTPEEKQNPK
jgi:hypothetical protein